ncbi:MAG TPA: ATP synthase F0 subunit C [Terriglobia bacterium]|nr:ATP synthase F0 subunit C [Terriglobia bacterium]
MMRKIMIFCTSIAGLLLTAPLFGAQGGAAAASSGGGANWVAITSGFAMAIASGLCGLGQGKAAAGACEGLARNPGARPGIQLFLILALIFIESLALYTLAIIFVKVR